MPQVATSETEFSVRVKIEILYFWMFILFIFSWISVELLARAINNFTFNTLGLDEKSTYQTTIIAFVVIFIQIVTIFYFRQLQIIDDNTVTNINNAYGIKNISDDDDTDLTDQYKKKFMTSNLIGMISELEEIAII